MRLGFYHQASTLYEDPGWYIDAPLVTEIPTGFTIAETEGETRVSESGTSDTFTVVLDAEPCSNVVLRVTSQDTGEAVVDQASLTFTPHNWDEPQTVTVTGVDDDLDGPIDCEDPDCENHDCGGGGICVSGVCQ